MLPKYPQMILVVINNPSRLIVIPLEVLRSHAPLPNSIPPTKQRSLASSIRARRHRRSTLIQSAADVVVRNAHCARITVIIGVARLSTLCFGERVDFARRCAMAICVWAGAAAGAVDDAFVACGDFCAGWAGWPCGRRCIAGGSG